MDIISLGKASKTLREIQKLDVQVVAPLAESRFPTVDARLDWLENQASQIFAVNSKQIDLTQGVLSGTEIVGGKLALTNTGTLSNGTTKTYTPSGTWESPVIDLGDSWGETKLIDVVKQVRTGVTVAIVEVSSSIDGLTFTPYAMLDINSLPQARYMKMRLTLTSPVQPPEVNTHQFNQTPANQVTLNEFLLADGDLRLKKEYSYTSTDVSLQTGGKIVSTHIPGSKFKKINTLAVN